MTRTIECFYPGTSFPAISVTGNSCALNCKHCARKYLEGMIPATTPEELTDVAEALVERGAKGFLLSGGADARGRVPIADFLQAIRDIKSTTDLKINAHIGLTSRSELRDLVSSGIDSFSIDVYGSDETIHDVLGLNARTTDYLEVFSSLVKEGASVVAPHICVGIHGGELKGEFKAIESFERFSPRELILISLIPTKDTAFQRVPVPSDEMILSVIQRARSVLPETRLLLGCMRSKKSRTSEFDFVAAGLDGIVLPSASTVEKLGRAGYKTKKRSVCCSIP